MRKEPPARPAAQSWWEGVVTWAILAGLTALAYWPSLTGGPLWDDDRHLTAPQLQSLHGLWRIWFDLGSTQQYYPLLHSAFWIEHRLWGDAVLFYHLTNVALHAATATLVVLLVRRLALTGAWLAGLLFALHPVCVESVAWISEQKSTLSGFFCLAAALAYLHFDRRRTLPRYLAGSALFLCALLTKSVTATLPAALAIILWWQRGRLKPPDWRPLAPWFAAGASMGLFTAWVERTVIGARGVTYTLTPLQHILLAPRIFCFYLAKLLLPVNLIFSYPRWAVDPSVWWQYLYPAAVLAIAGAALLLAKHTRGPLASLLVFAVTLFPVLGFLPVYPFRYSWVADHFQYLASVAILVPLAAWFPSIAARFAPSRLARTIPACLAVAALAFLTWRQSANYRDEETLYRATLARNPASSMAHNNLGVILARTPGELPEAIAEYQEAIRIQPDNAEAHCNLANAIARMPDRVEDAIAEYQTAERLKPDYLEAYHYFGDLLARLPSRLPDAVSQYRMALKIRPDLAGTHANLANVLARMPGSAPEAIAEYETALRLLPDSPGMRVALGNVLARQPERLAEAVSQFRAALRSDPSLPDAHYSLANALSRMPGEQKEAIDECRIALHLQPDLEPAEELLQQLAGR